MYCLFSVAHESKGYDGAGSREFESEEWSERSDFIVGLESENALWLA